MTFIQNSLLSVDTHDRKPSFQDETKLYVHLLNLHDRMNRFTLLSAFISDKEGLTYRN